MAEQDLTLGGTLSIEQLLRHPIYANVDLQS